MTFDVDIGKGQHTVFGIHGLPYGANVSKPIDIQKIISRAIGRRFHLSDDKLTPIQTKQAYIRLRNAYIRESKNALKGRGYTGSDFESWLPEGALQDNLVITRRYLMLFSEAVIQGKGIYFR